MVICSIMSALIQENLPVKLTGIHTYITSFVVGVNTKWTKYFIKKKKKKRQNKKLNIELKKDRPTQNLISTFNFNNYLLRWSYLNRE
jgi:hypothetical protein